ncbi:hypothetical protein Q762_13845, partial [Flavobacterium cauense R2A-7]|uniref:hypothetical protein n=1 Tax=Flavobacterium cauense TaxID=510946 RepID=UPI00052E2BE6
LKTPQKSDNNTPLAPIEVEIPEQSGGIGTESGNCDRKKARNFRFKKENYTLHIYCMCFYKRLYLHLII